MILTDIKSLPFVLSFENQIHTLQESINTLSSLDTQIKSLLTALQITSLSSTPSFLHSYQALRKVENNILQKLPTCEALKNGMLAQIPSLNNNTPFVASLTESPCGYTLDNLEESLKLNNKISQIYNNILNITQRTYTRTVLEAPEIILKN